VTEFPYGTFNMSETIKYKIKQPGYFSQKSVHVVGAGEHKVSTLIKLVQSERKFEKENLISFYSFQALQSGGTLL
jgi:hypothetical protein